MSQIANQLKGWDTNGINLRTEIFLPKIAFDVHENHSLKLRVVSVGQKSWIFNIQEKSNPVPPIFEKMSLDNSVD